MVKFEILSRKKKEVLAEVERLGEEEDFHHFYWQLTDPDTACKECLRRNNLSQEYAQQFINRARGGRWWASSITCAAALRLSMANKHDVHSAPKLLSPLPLHLMKH